MTKFGAVTQMGRSVFLQVSHATISRVGTPASSKIFATSYTCAHTCIRNSNQILHGAVATIFGDRMLNRDLFDVATCNLVMPPPLIGGGIKQWCCLTLTSVCRVHRS